MQFSLDDDVGEAPEGWMRSFTEWEGDSDFCENSVKIWSLHRFPRNWLHKVALLYDSKNPKLRLTTLTWWTISWQCIGWAATTTTVERLVEFLKKIAIRKKWLDRQKSKLCTQVRIIPFKSDTIESCYHLKSVTAWFFPMALKKTTSSSVVNCASLSVAVLIFPEQSQFFKTQFSSRR